MGGWRSPRITWGKTVPLCFECGDFCFEQIDLPAGPGLSPIKAPRIEKPGTSDSMAIQIHGGCGDQRSDSPIEPEHIPHFRARSLLGHRDRDGEVEYCVAPPIALLHFT